MAPLWEQVPLLVPLFKHVAASDKGVLGGMGRRAETVDLGEWLLFCKDYDLERSFHVTRSDTVYSFKCACATSPLDRHELELSLKEFCQTILNVMLRSPLVLFGPSVLRTSSSCSLSLSASHCSPDVAESVMKALTHRVHLNYTPHLPAKKKGYPETTGAISPVDRVKIPPGLVDPLANKRRRRVGADDKENVSGPRTARLQKQYAGLLVDNKTAKEAVPSWTLQQQASAQSTPVAPASATVVMSSPSAPSSSAGPAVSFSPSLLLWKPLLGSSLPNTSFLLFEKAFPSSDTSSSSTPGGGSQHVRSSQPFQSPRCGAYRSDRAVYDEASLQTPIRCHHAVGHGVRFEEMTPTTETAFVTKNQDAYMAHGDDKLDQDLDTLMNMVTTKFSVMKNDYGESALFRRKAKEQERVKRVARRLEKGGM